MSDYSSLAFYYDRLTENVDYEKRADYILALMKRHEAPAGGRVLDAGCGTGTLTVLLAKRGLDMMGFDKSPEMLSAAAQKAAREVLEIPLIQGDLREMDLYGSMTNVISSLDTFNHITSAAGLNKAFSRVSLFTQKGGLFIFDVNTVYKSRSVLAGNTFVYDLDDLYCVWTCEGRRCGLVNDISIDIFVKEGDGYRRYSDELVERSYPLAQLEQLLTDNGFTVEGVYSDLKFTSPGRRDERVWFVCRKN